MDAPSKLAAALAAPALVLTLALAGCGGDPEEPASAGEPPTAAGEPVPDEPKPPREVLRIPDEKSPVIWVKVKRDADIYDEPGGKVIETVGHETEFGSRTVFGVYRTRGREWAGVSTPYGANGSLAWVRLDPRVWRSGSVTSEVEVDLSDYEARLILNDKLVRTFAVSIGMPGAPTPTGRYTVTDTFRGNLSAAYGCCAVALTARQTRLPSGWLGGDRIAIHGTDGPLGSMVSHGCIRAADESVSELVDKLALGTPVTITQ